MQKIVYPTGWSRMFGKAEYFSDFPTLTLEAAEWIAERRIGLLGMDTPTPTAQWKEVHGRIEGRRRDRDCRGIDEFAPAPPAIHTFGVSFEFQRSRRGANPSRSAIVK